MRVAAFQFDVRRGEVEANLVRVEAGLREAAERGIELVVLPEMWPTSFVAEGEAVVWQQATDRAVERVRELSRELDLVVAGSAFGPGREGQSPRNRLSVFEAGEPRLSYDKLHLFSPTAEGLSFSAGEALPRTVELARAKLSGIVCYDLRFALALRDPFRDEAEILVLPAQWPASREVHWRALVCGRAAELQAFVIAANRTGTDVLGRRRLELSFGGNSSWLDPMAVSWPRGRGPKDSSRPTWTSRPSASCAESFRYGGTNAAPCSGSSGPGARLSENRPRGDVLGGPRSGSGLLFGRSSGTVRARGRGPTLSFGESLNPWNRESRWSPGVPMSAPFHPAFPGRLAPMPGRSGLGLSTRRCGGPGPGPVTPSPIRGV